MLFAERCAREASMPFQPVSQLHARIPYIASVYGGEKMLEKANDKKWCLNNGTANSFRWTKKKRWVCIRRWASDIIIIFIIIFMCTEIWRKKFKVNREQKMCTHTHIHTPNAVSASSLHAKFSFTIHSTTCQAWSVYILSICTVRAVPTTHRCITLLLLSLLLSVAHRHRHGIHTHQASHTYTQYTCACILCILK